MSSVTARWIQLEGAVNVRDVGGMTTADGRAIRPGALIRSANLQHLTATDVTTLVRDLGVRRVVDLRTDVEVERAAPGLLHAQPDVVVHHLSLYPDSDGNAENVVAIDENPADSTDDDAAKPVLPWQGDKLTPDRAPVVSSYLRYLTRRPDSIVAALRAIAEPDGATLVHCAAGKDRTGVVVALALTIVGVPPESVAADYALTQSQMALILAHLARSDLYDREVTQPDQIPTASAEVMEAVLSAVRAEYGSVLGWLASHGWTERDTEALRAKLVGPSQQDHPNSGR
ncbi:tyrosine-protein phosphatase [Jatrophihabitans lederbergiae]|uniref:Tyrosine-protein phosphatase n=1 Tax=Jatrophihabitans lederbergiae TaxID=3075547 RepID=A0ABU2JDS8_9ACTN|nr:tyrosine-protein phosphatase [Jatrophihabitans sp. DSM 44399]MDT0262896.1 tyrosine-protein phosphatase [Jatrophihabitans sp. DSM 44399]